MSEQDRLISTLSSDDVERIASALATKLRAEPPQLSHSDVERIAGVLADRLGGKGSAELLRTAAEADAESAGEVERTWVEQLERHPPDAPDRGRALEGL